MAAISIRFPSVGTRRVRHDTPRTRAAQFNDGMTMKTILTVDDSSLMRQMIKYTLAGAGYSVIEAVDGIDALAKLTVPVHLVITDLNMPNLDGIGLVKKIRSNPAYKGLPILILTTEAARSRALAGKAAGATGWIVKPFNSAQLLSVLQRVIGPPAA